MHALKNINFKKKMLLKKIKNVENNLLKKL